MTGSKDAPRYVTSPALVYSIAFPAGKALEG